MFNTKFIVDTPDTDLDLSAIRKKRNTKSKRKLLTERHKAIRKEIKALEEEKAEINEQLRIIQRINNTTRGKTIYLYALRLEGDKWYVGATTDAERRFRQHKKGSGAKWTKKYPPIELVEVRETEHRIMEDASLDEDDMTIEYAMKYGGCNVRGGGYVQVNHVMWPEEVLQSDLRSSPIYA